ncbi:WD40 repeat-like protein, partial [Dichomitus squalens LYAD-421 SS1]
GHDSSVNALVISPDGRWVATASDDSTIILWDARTACISEEWFAHDRQVSDLAFSPDGRHLASAGSGGQVVIWDISRDRPHQTATLEGHNLGYIRGCAFSPKSTRVAVGYMNGVIRVWNMETRQDPLWWKAHEDQVLDVAFSPDGRLLLSASSDNTVKTWNTRNGAMVQSLEGHERLVSAACFSPCGQYIASASSDLTVRVWRTSDGSCSATLSDHGDAVMHVAFTPDGTMLWSTGWNGTVLGRRLEDIIPNDFNSTRVDNRLPLFRSASRLSR